MQNLLGEGGVGRARWILLNLNVLLLVPSPHSQRASIQTATQASSLTHGSEWGCIQAATDRNFSSLSLTTSQRSRELREHLGEMGQHSRSVTLRANPLILCKKCVYVKWNQRVHLFGQGETEPTLVPSPSWMRPLIAIYLTLEVLSLELETLDLVLRWGV